MFDEIKLMQYMNWLEGNTADVSEETIRVAKEHAKAENERHDGLSFDMGMALGIVLLKNKTMGLLK